MSAIEHGTYAGLQRCKKRPEGACSACKKAGAEYMAERRKTKPGARSAELLSQYAADKARRRLVQNHLLEYRELFAEEKRRLLAESKEKRS